MTIAELINELSQYTNLNAEVKVRLGWQLDGPLHYTREVVEGTRGEPVIGVSWQVDDPERDLAEPDELYRVR
jgi:hypothetical protein